MADRMITFNLDKLISTIQRVAPELPGLMGMATAKIPQLAPFASYADMLPAVAEFAGKLAGPSSPDSLPGLPDIGNTARGRLQYLRHKDNWTDEQVCRAVEIVLAQIGPKSAKIYSMVEYTSRFMFPEAKGSYSDTQTRVAIDNLLDSDDGLPADTADQLGGHLHYVLTHNKK